MDFEKRLKSAINRGERARDQRDSERVRKALSAEDLRNLHSTLRIELTDHIEECLRQLVDHFPGFRFETVLGASGWGARLNRDDVDFRRGQSRNLYSRLEVLISPYGSAPIIELVAKGTIRNKEVFDRKHYHRLDDVDPDTFRNMIDLWVLEYAEKFAAEA